MAPDLETSVRPRFLAVLIVWCRRRWPDVLVLILLGSVSLFLDRVPPPFERTFAVYQDTLHTVVSTDLAYPSRSWLLSSVTVGCVALLVPLGVFIISQWWIRSFWDFDAAVMGLLQSVMLTMIFQMVLKVLVGGLRPNFLDVCQPDLGPLADLDTDLSETQGSELSEGQGFGQIFFTTSICTQTNNKLMRLAMTSFPSGHSATGVAGLAYLSLWLNAKLKVWADHRPEFWRVLLTMMPILMASINCCLLNVDRMHHWYDIVGGAMIGIVMAIISYRSVYAGIWDWRYNHVFLSGVESFDYGAQNTKISHGTLIKKAGWKMARGRDDDSQLGSLSLDEPLGSQDQVL